MNTLASRLPILLIEDETSHASQVRQRLEEAGYHVTHFTTLRDDNELLFSFIAENPGSQIAIVDLKLGTSKDWNPEEGLNLIRKQLWPIDRTMYFVVFSQHIDYRKLPQQNRVEPHWTFVGKENKDGKLSNQCLDNLLSVVEHCWQYSSPLLETPSYNSFDWIGDMQLYVQKRGLPDMAFHRAVREAVLKSVDVLNDLSRTSAFYIKAGASVRQLAIGVYGSCGRLEMRPDSDIEFSVYYSSQEGALPDRQMAVTFWNRLKSHMERKGLKYEGQDKIAANNPKLLTINQAGLGLGNTFRAVIDRDELLSADLRKAPHIRNRHFQTLTEVRAVFNPRFLFDLKRDLILRKVGAGTRDVWAIARSSYMEDVINQFFSDSRPEAIKSLKDLKLFCYRFLNIVAVRIALVGELTFGEPVLRSDEEWEHLFEVLGGAGIVKLIRFVNLFSSRVVKIDAKGRRILREMEKLIDAYFRLFGLFTDISVRSLVGGVQSEQDEQVQHLRRDVKDVAELFVEVCNLIREYKVFNPVHRVNWLLNVDRIQEFIVRL